MFSSALPERACLLNELTGYDACDARELQQIMTPAVVNCGLLPAEALLKAVDPVDSKDRPVCGQACTN